MNHKPTLEIARRVVETVNAGLCSGLGQAVPGRMCVEAAVNYAFGLPHGDEPPCVGSAVRSFKIALNDAGWSSESARGKGMLKIAVAQLGSNEIDQRAFSKLLALKVIQKLCPDLFRELAKLAKNDADKTAMSEAAEKCAAAVDLKSGLEILESARARALALALDLDRALARALALARDQSLTLLADICLECLIELKSPGCEWLFLCGNKS